MDGHSETGQDAIPASAVGKHSSISTDSYTLNYIAEVSTGLQGTLASDEAGAELPIDQALQQWVEETKQLQNSRGKIFFVGNGASASIAEHLSHDCFQNGNLLTQTISETAHLTAIANDLSFEEVFSYRIGKSAEPKDMLVTISSSGNSPNIIKAIQTAKETGMFVVTLSGMSAVNRSRQSGSLNFYVPLPTYGLVESAHAVLMHCWLDLFMDKYLGGRH